MGVDQTYKLKEKIKIMCNCQNYRSCEPETAVENMLQALECASGYAYKIIKSIRVSAKTTLSLSQDTIKHLKLVSPTQSHQIDNWVKRMSEGYEPYEFLLPSEPFMSTCILPFSEDFFKYRSDANSAMATSLELINDARSDFEIAWWDLMRELKRQLPNSSDVIKLDNSLSQMESLFEKRILMGDDEVDMIAFQHAFETLKSKLSDVSAELRTNRPDVASMVSQNTTILKRIDNRLRTRTDAAKEKADRQKHEDQCLALWKYHQEHGENLNEKKGKKPKRDLFKIHAEELESYGIRTEADLQKAIRNAQSRENARKKSTGDDE